MSAQPRYRIVCSVDREGRGFRYHDRSEAERVARYNDALFDCGPHRVDEVPDDPS